MVTKPAQAAPAPAAVSVEDAYRGIVKIEVAVRMPDYSKPWQSGAFGRGNGTGFMVGKGLFMTNAHVVANAERIYISPYADARKIPAHVKYVAHDCDLALVEVDELDAFADVPCLEFSDSLPKLEDTVRAIGYPIGGSRLSVTRGIVSRIESIPYSHPRNIAHLTVQIDAAINPGNSGGPVLLGDKVVGVAFQGLLEANSTGYMIPMPVIKRFLKDIEDGVYDQYVDLGAVFFSLENPAMRAHYKLPQQPVGVVVSDIAKGGSCDGVLQVGDIVLAVNDCPVDSSAMIELDGERMQLEELAERSFKGEQVRFRILRDGKPQEVVATLKAAPGKSVNTFYCDVQPRYVQFGGLIFQPLDLNVVAARRIDVKEYLVEINKFMARGDSLKKKDLILITEVLTDEVNARFGGRVTNSMVSKVNGVEVTSLDQLAELLYPKDGKRPDYTVIEVVGGDRPIIIDNATIDAANERISTGYGIPAPARLK